MDTGKYTPPKNQDTPFINPTNGSPLLNNIIKDAEIMPMLEKEIIVKAKITIEANMFAFARFNPKNNLPTIK